MIHTGDRRKVIETWAALQAHIDAYQRGELARTTLWEQWFWYRMACRLAGEGAFCIEDVLEPRNIGEDYPQSGAALFEVLASGIYHTDVWEAKLQRLRTR